MDSHRTLLMLYLRRRSGLVRRACGGLFRGSRPRGHAASPAVETDPIDGRVIDYRLVVNIVNVGDIHMADRAIVIKLLALPVPAGVTTAGVAETVVDAAVEPDRCTPVTFVPSVPPVAPTPVPRRPEQSK